MPQQSNRSVLQECAEVSESKPQFSHQRLTNGRLLARNSFWSLFGNMVPMLVALICMPILIRGLGKDRFGVLTLAWALIGYASLFDLGLGRALTQLVARKLGAGDDHAIPSVSWTSLSLMSLLGIAAAALVIVISPVLVHRLLNIQPALQYETLQSFRLLGISIPFVITTAGLRGLLEAHQRFRLITALRIPMGVLTFAGPLLVLPFSRSLVAVVASLVVGRVMLWAAYLVLCLRTLPALRRLTWDTGSVGSLLRFGSWMTVANAVNPVLVSMDRFLIGIILPVAMVGFYTVPFEAVSKMWLIPVSLTATVFPACGTIGTSRKEELSRLYSRSIKYLFLLLAPISLIVFLFAGNILQFWLGHEFADKSTAVLRLLSVGVFVNCFAHIPFCFIQGLGRPDVTAKLFALELLPYAGFAWLMIHHEGILGAAIAWSIRAALELVALLWLAWRLYSLSPRTLLGQGTIPALAALCMLGLAIVLTMVTLRNSLSVEILLTVVWLAIFSSVTWKFVFDDSDRGSILRIVALRN